MRYTTIIDISEFPALYRNVNLRLLYFHLCLKAGYHDHDRDICDISIRQLANDVGLTLSATRHALHVLKTSSLISYEGTTIKVKKWISEAPISKRKNTKKTELQETQKMEHDRLQAQLEKEILERSEHKKKLSQMGKTDFMIYYESLMVRAENGDAEALRLLSRHRQTYESHKSQFLKSK